MAVLVLHTQRPVIDWSPKGASYICFVYFHILFDTIFWDSFWRRPTELGPVFFAHLEAPNIFSICILTHKTILDISSSSLSRAPDGHFQKVCTFCSGWWGPGVSIRGGSISSVISKTPIPHKHIASNVQYDGANNSQIFTNRLQDMSLSGTTLWNPTNHHDFVYELEANRSLCFFGHPLGAVTQTKTFWHTESLISVFYFSVFVFIVWVVYAFDSLVLPA